MIYRVKMYEIFPERLTVFNAFFQEYLLPNQRRFGAQLIGRWVNEDRTRITAIWGYQSKEQYEHIEAQIRQTDLHQKAKLKRESLGPLFVSSKQEFWEMTGDYKLNGD